WERWKAVAPGLVEDLLDSNPLHLGLWVSALEPVSDRLAGPLGVVFRDGKPERAGRREAAAQALKIYLTRKPDPEALRELLLAADAKQYALLLPLLEVDRERAVAQMDAELAKQPDYWKDAPVDASWKTPDAAIVAEIEKARGFVAEHFALCQALPMARLNAVCETMRKAGYRPMSVRPWSSRGTGETSVLRVALVWRRDGREWQLE